MKKILSVKFFLVVVFLASPQHAFAHVTLEQKTALTGSYYKAVLMVGHGCEGSATKSIKVKIPEGLNGAKPMPKRGWNIGVKVEKLVTPYESHGKTITEDVTEIIWVATGREMFLADAHFDEFVLRGKLHDKAGPMWFKVYQSCEKGQNDWAEIPASGTSTKGLKTPAALLEITPAAEPAHHH